MSNCIGCKFYDSSVDCCNAEENCYQKGRADENTKIIGFLKYHRYAIVDNNGDYYSIEEFEDMLKGVEE